jgi:molybdate transport system regulatory protein
VSLHLRTKVWFERDGTFVIGDGGLRLLIEVASLGSLLAAARQIGWSYRHAWQYLRRAERALGAPLVARRPGKGARRGTVLTPQGRHIVELLRQARGRVDRVAGVSGPTREELAARGNRQRMQQRPARRSELAR